MLLLASDLVMQDILIKLKEYKMDMANQKNPGLKTYSVTFQDVLHNSY